MKTGAVMVAAGPAKPEEAPMLPVGRASTAQRMIAAFRKAGVSTIVVVTDGDSRKLEKHLAQRGVLFLHSGGGAAGKAFGCAKLGLEYLRGRCGRVFLTTADTPLFLPSTLELMLQSDGDIVIPTFEKRAGYPILLSQRAMTDLLADGGRDSIRAALSRCKLPKTRVAVEDEGVLIPADEAREHPQREAQSLQLTRPVLDIAISTEKPLLDSRLMVLLQLIDENRSVRTACDLTQISYSTAWNTLNAVEDVLGYPLATRNKGGPSGSGTFLTPRGRELMEAYERFETALEQQAQALYEQYFGDIL